MSKIAKALEKAKKDRIQDTEQAVQAPAGQAAGQAAAPQQAPPFESCQLKYNQTRVVNVEDDLFEPNFILLGLDDDELWDRYNLLRTHILQRTKQAGWNTIMITSAVPGEGKTITAINLALTMARESQQTSLLVDANFRNPKIHTYMCLGQNKGLTDYLLDDVPLPELLINPGIEKLVVLPAGRHYQGAVDLLGSPKLQSLVKDLKNRYPERYVIYDCPHLLDMPDSLVFSTYVDAVLLVVDSTTTSRDDVRDAVEMLKDRNLIGLVMNKNN